MGKDQGSAGGDLTSVRLEYLNYEIQFYIAVDANRYGCAQFAKFKRS